MSTPFVMTLTDEQSQALKNRLTEEGFEFSTPAHTLFSAKKPRLSITLYKSKKLTIVGKNAKEFIEFTLEPLLGLLSSPIMQASNIIPHIGTDEAGKGDFFGPLVVAGVFVNSNIAKELLSLGIKDSKTISDKKIFSLAPHIVRLCPNYIISLMPTKYNELYEKFKNLNRLLAWCHATVIDRLVTYTKCQEVLVDKFAHESLIERCLHQKNNNCHVVQRTKAESDIAVAAASCLARFGFLQGMDKLSQDMGYLLPKGSSSPKVIEIAKEIKKQKGESALQSCTKQHFKCSKDCASDNVSLCYNDLP